MKHLRNYTYLSICLAFFICLTGCKSETKSISENLRFCEAILNYNNYILCANFGDKHGDTYNQEGKGYITIYNGKDNSVLIPADGNLSAPKGMAIKNNYLFIADVQKVVIYDLEHLSLPPRTIKMPAKEILVTDVAVMGDVLFIAVVNTGNIYILDITDPNSINESTLAVYVNIPGANVMCTTNEYKLYIGSSPLANKLPIEDNVLYVIDDIMQPMPKKLIHDIGAYTGIVVSPAKQTLYFIDVKHNIIGGLSLKNGKIKKMPMKKHIDHQNKICLFNRELYVTDFENQTVLTFDLDTY